MASATRLETARGERPATCSPDRMLAVGLVLLACGLVLVALLGPLAAGAIRYPISETLKSQAIGLDAVSLLVVAPLAAAAAWWARRGREAGARLVLPALAFLAFVRYLPALVDAAADTQDAGYLAGPTFFWTIALLDLGVFLPATVAACWGLVRGTAWRSSALYLIAGWFGLVGPAVAAMGVAMYLREDPNASLAGAVFMAVLGAAFAALAVVVYLPLLRRRVP
jgi:hypothetical protein